MAWNGIIMGFASSRQFQEGKKPRTKKRAVPPNKKKKNQEEGSIQNRTESYSSSAEEKMRSGAAIRPGAAGKMKQQPAQAWQHTQEEIKKILGLGEHS